MLACDRRDGTYEPDFLALRSAHALVLGIQQVGGRRDTPEISHGRLDRSPKSLAAGFGTVDVRDG